MKLGVIDKGKAMYQYKCQPCRVNDVVQASGLSSYAPSLTQKFVNDAYDDSLLRKGSY